MKEQPNSRPALIPSGHSAASRDEHGSNIRHANCEIKFVSSFGKEFRVKKIMKRKKEMEYGVGGCTAICCSSKDHRKRETAVKRQV